MLTDLGNLEACFFFGIKAMFMENREISNDLRCTAEGGHDVADYLHTILLYRDNGGATTDDTTKWYMRWVAGGVNMTLLTPKIGTWKRLTCGPNLVEEHHSAEGFPQSIR
jgi:hypothetical protein